MTEVERRDTVIDAVRYDLHLRSQLGIKKYGTTLAENPAEMKERLQHAYEEALDLANYLKWAIMELEDSDYWRKNMIAENDPGSGVYITNADNKTRAAMARSIYQRGE